MVPKVFKIIAVITHIATGQMATIVAHDRFSSMEQCVKAIPHQIAVWEARAEYLATAKLPKLDGKVHIQARCED